MHRSCLNYFATPCSIPFSPVFGSYNQLYLFWRLCFST